MKKLLLSGFAASFFLQTTAQFATISGYVKDSLSGEILIGASVTALDLKKGTITNNYGYFSLTLPATGNIIIVVSHVSHLVSAFTVNNKEKTSSTFFLPPAPNQLNEVVIMSGRKDFNVQKARISTIDIPIKVMKTIPMIAGERDVLKVVQFLPGVQSGNEGTTGFYVRGGNTDQNLVQLDEAIVYNPNHLFGLFSTFNVNALKNVTLIKGGFPAQYGGRLSSILDITMKDGNKYKWKGEGGIGLLTSNLTLEGPIQKKRSSFIISARRSYFDIIAKPFIPKNKNNTSFYLYDVNAKVNFELGKNDQLFMSFFKGNDVAAYTGANSLNYGINFGNSTGSIRWNHLFGHKLFLNTSLINNNYHLSLSTTQNNSYALFYTSIKDLSAKTALEWHPDNRQTIITGIQYTNHALAPAAYSSRVPRRGPRHSIKPDSINRIYSDESAFFINDEYVISPKLGMNAGFRIPSFSSMQKTYSAFEPRMTIKYSIDSGTSVKIAYTDMTQFLHLVPSSTASLPTDIWLSSSGKVKPQKSRQIAGGVFKNFKDNQFETSIEVYYKNTNGQVLFKEGTQVIDSINIERQLDFGKGKSYGVELFIRKNGGNLTGWVSYTLSKTTQQFDSLNSGKEFPFTYDRRHVLNIVTSYQLNKRWNLAANFVFNTGSALTVPSGRIPVFADASLYDGNYYDFTERNNYRLRSYHRLDISASYRKTRKIFRKQYDSEWVFSIYNLYSRLNPYFIYLTVDPITQQPKAKQVSLLPIVPGVSYNFNF